MTPTFWNSLAVCLNGMAWHASISLDMSHHCIYNKDWESKYSWVKPFKGDKRKALCVKCDRIVDIGSMGEAALKSHMRGNKHKKLDHEGTVNLSISSFFKTDGPSDDTSKSSHGDTAVLPRIPPLLSASNENLQMPNITKYQINEDTVKAEILWTLKLITDHQSYRSSENAGKMFQKMFPDSQIAKQFTCGERKAAYLGTFGIAEYFTKLLHNSISASDYFSILFDESLNHKMQEKQIDVHVRLWDVNLKHVESRFFTSLTLGHATADDMVKHFDEILENGLPIKNLVQIGMDGPNVNFKFYSTMKDKLKQDYDTALLNLGSCGLHTLHNAFKEGAESTGWKISSFLSSMYYLLKDSPARREDYTKTTGMNSQMPLKFANHRWLENVPVCERALLIHDKMKAFVKAVAEKKVNTPLCKSYAVVSEGVKDKLICPKLHFFKSVAMILQPFLAKYQTDKPMVYFLYDDLLGVIKSLLRRVFKAEVMQEKSDDELVKINVDDKSLYLSHKKVDIGFSCENALKECKNVSEREILEFRMECRTFILKILKKILMKSPTQYSIVKHLSCMHPRRMVSSADDCTSKLKKLLKHLLTANKMSENECEQCLQQFTAFIENIPSFGTERFRDFNSNTELMSCSMN